MKNLSRILLVLFVLGVALAIAVTNASTKPLVRNGQEEEAQRLMKQVREAVRERAENKEASTLPAAVCTSNTFDFGLMDPLTVGTHVFEIKNNGGAPLILQGGESSCKCTLSDLKEAVLQPGETFAVKLTWNSGHAKREFKQSAIVRTNDPTKGEIVLTVSGEVRAVLAALPNTINFDRLIPASPTSVQFALYSQVWDGMEIERIESTNEHVSAVVSDKAFTQSFAFDDEIKNATSQAIIEVRFDGEAPQGDLQGQLRIYVRPPATWSLTADPENADTNSADTNENSADLPDIVFPTQEDGTVLAEIPFYGSVVRRLSLYGKAVQSRGYLDLGTVKPADSAGRKWVIIGRLRGATMPDEILATVDGIPGLKATVEPMDSANAKASFRLSLELAESMKPAIYNREQAGNLRIELPGMPAGDDILEMPIHLIVIEK